MGSVVGLSGWRALIGGLAPFWIIGGATIVGPLLRSGYRPSQAASVLGEQGASNAVIWNVLGFGVGAALFFMWAVAVGAALGRGWLYRLSVLLAISIAACGLFSCDPGCPQVMTTWQGWGHTVAGLSCFVLFFVLPLVGWRVFRRLPDSGPVERVSLAVGIVLLALFVAGPFVFGESGVGYWQRITVPIFGVWTVVVALRLSQVRSGVAAAPRPG